MFSSSTQMKNWTFSGTTELNKLRVETNEKFMEEHSKKYNKSPDEYLTAAEERLVCRHFEYVLKSFCGNFKPPMPPSVVGIAIAYFKRFYLHSSIMDYNPKHLVYTCVYLACKVDEFNVSIMQFVSNLPMGADREKTADIILSHELLLMRKLNYNLTIHLPYRPVEGQLLDIKTRCPQVNDVDRLRGGAEEFLDICLNTDVSLIFAPSQISLSAILSSAAKQGLNLDSYVANTLLGNGKKEDLMKAVEHIKRIRFMVKQLEPLNREDVRKIRCKLQQCCNEENDPDTEAYRLNLEEMQDEDGERQLAKRRKMTEAQLIEDRKLLGI